MRNLVAIREHDALPQVSTRLSSKQSVASRHPSQRACYLFMRMTMDEPLTVRIGRGNSSIVQFRPEYCSMKVSLRSTYGILAAVDLAMQTNTVPTQAKSIARRQGIPARFLEQVLHAMKKAGLVTSLRGAQGGYVLSKKPSEVSVAEILEALDGPVLSVVGQNGQGSPRRAAKSEILLAAVWDRVCNAERKVLEAVTVEELAGQQRLLEQQRSPMYHI
jgi:Rrf2 family transcriptional regulator, cysteine metabolism repressor